MARAMTARQPLARLVRSGKPEEPDPEAVYICVMGYAINAAITRASGSGDIVREGERRRGSDPAVRAAPLYWVLDGTPNSEIAQRRTALFSPAYRPEPPSPPAPEIKEEDLVIALEAGAGSERLLPPSDHRGATREITVGWRAGEIMHRDDPRVRKHRRAFRSVTNGVPRERAMRAKEDVWGRRYDANGEPLGWGPDEQHLVNNYGPFKRFLLCRRGEWRSVDDELVQSQASFFEPVGPLPANLPALGRPVLGYSALTPEELEADDLPNAKRLMESRI
jgi:hypothetical protein